MEADSRQGSCANAGTFEEMVRQSTGNLLHCSGIDLIQVNVGLRCNQACAHCHVDASPDRTEVMEWPVMASVLDAVRIASCRMVDITGGAPELNPHLRRFIGELSDLSCTVQVRTNLTALLDPGMETLPKFFRDHRVQLVASMPCYLEENVLAQRGDDVYADSIQVLRRLNELGYGAEPDLGLNLVYNPGGPSLPPDQGGLEADYRRELAARFGITFSKLLAITNMPIGRFRDSLRREGREDEYLALLAGAFNPQAIDGLMCRHQVSVGWDGTLYDCDFNLALQMPVDHGAPSRLSEFDVSALATRRVMTADHCFGCTAGAGSSCSGTLA